MSKFHISTKILQGDVLFSGKIYTAGKIFTRPPVVTNFKSDNRPSTSAMKILADVKNKEDPGGGDDIAGSERAPQRFPTELEAVFRAELDPDKSWLLFSGGFERNHLQMIYTKSGN